MTKKTSNIILIVIIALALILSTVMIVDSVRTKKAKAVIADSNDKYKSKDKLFDSQKEQWVKESVEISTDVIEDGLRDMGQLVTQEYYFTQAETYEKTSSIGPLSSTAKMIYSYDGVVYAGIDCNDITVDKNDENKTIKVTIPKAEITSVDIDYDSFKEFESKQGLWSKIELSDVNKSLQEFKSEAKNNAVEKGVLNSADKNAELIIEHFARALINNSDYSITFIHK